ncbi:MAG: hypothetical protein IPJ65_17440 [Archangiaceae bacterium]|nr:hypothetical protein [Archangiaceae bacterium]
MRISLVVSLLVSALTHAASLTLDKQPVLLGKTEAVGVTITLDEPAGAEVRPLRVAVNVGSFSVVQRLGPGKYKATYVPPATRFPQVALVAVWRETGAEAPIEFLRIPLFGSTKLPVGAKPGSEVTAEVGELSFGPVKVDGDGRVEVPISVPPGLRDVGVKVREPRGGLANKRIGIEVPPYNRVTAALVPHAIVADGQGEARLDVFYDLGGADVPASRVKVAASVGEVRLERAEGGRYVYRYRPPAGTNAANVDFNVTVSGDPTARASATLQLGQPPPDKLVVRPPPQKLRADGVAKAKVEVIVFDEAGLGLSGQDVHVAANGSGLGLATYRGNGLYELEYVAPAEFPPGGLVQFVATDGKLTGAANYQLVAPSAPSEVTARVVPDPIPADGRTDAVVRLDVRDAAGLPLTGAKLLAVASHGTLGPLEEEGEGRYVAHLQAPGEVPDGKALIRVVDSTGTFEQKVELPMRENPRRFLIGVRGGITHSLQELFGPRVGVDLSLAVRLGSVMLWLSGLVQGGLAQQTVTDGSGGLSSRSQLWFVPLQARVAAELWAGRRLSVLLGAAGGATWARYTTTLTGLQSVGWGPAAGGFAAMNLAAGPGHLFLELGYTWSPVSGEGFRVETGGLGLALGYRLGVL